MSVLSDYDIKLGQQNGPHFSGFRITPWNEGRVQPASYDVAMGRQYRVFKNTYHGVIDLHRIPDDLTELISSDRMILHPGEFMLGITEEDVHLGPNLVARLEGKSSLGRVGLVIHSTAGWIDPGFHGKVTLEMSNNGRIPLVLHAGMLIGQLAFMTMTSPAVRPYGHPTLNSKYQGDQEPSASRYSDG